MTRRSPEALNAKLMMLVAEAGAARVARLRRAPCSRDEAQARLDSLLGGGPAFAAPTSGDAADDGFAADATFDFDGGSGEDDLAAAPDGGVEEPGGAGLPADVPVETAWDDAGDAPADAAWDDAGDAPADAARDDAGDAPAEAAWDDAGDAPADAARDDAGDAPAGAADVPVETAWDDVAGGTASAASPSPDFDDIAIASRDAFTAPPVADEIALAEEVRDLADDDDVPSGPPSDEADRAAPGRDSGLLSSVKKLFRK